MRASASKALLALLIGFALLMVAPTARAAAQQCAEEAVSRPEAAVEVVPHDPTATPWICDGAVIVLGRGDEPMCLNEGASAVAPPIIHSTGDARIEAYRRCNMFEDPSEVATPSDDSPDKTPTSPPEATVSALPPLPPAVAAAMVVLPSPPAPPASGHSPEVYRPPRG